MSLIFGSHISAPLSKASVTSFSRCVFGKERSSSRLLNKSPKITHFLVLFLSEGLRYFADEQLVPSRARLKCRDRNSQSTLQASQAMPAPAAKHPASSTFKGRCLCGATQYSIAAEPFAPHTCSCTMCQQWAGAPTVPWVSFKGSLTLTGEHKSLSYYESSQGVQRGRCKTCGSPIEVLDERYPGETCIIMTSLEPESLAKVGIPNEWHNEAGNVPSWWQLDVGGKRRGFVRDCRD